MHAHAVVPKRTLLYMSGRAHFFFSYSVASCVPMFLAHDVPYLALSGPLYSYIAIYII